MIALVGALRLQAGTASVNPSRGFTVKPRWDLASL
jgi:hypothetical protein